MSRNDRLRFLALVLSLAVSRAAATEQTPEPAPEPAQANAIEEAAGYGHRIELGEGETADTVVFTELVPMTVDENPVRLPPDQSLD